VARLGGPTRSDGNLRNHTHMKVSRSAVLPGAVDPSSSHRSPSWRSRSSHQQQRSRPVTPPSVSGTVAAHISRERGKGGEDARPIRMPETISMASEGMWNGRTTEPAVFMLMLMLVVRLIGGVDGKLNRDFGLIQSWRAHPTESGGGPSECGTGPRDVVRAVWEFSIEGEPCDAQKRDRTPERVSCDSQRCGRRTRGASKHSDEGAFSLLIHCLVEASPRLPPRSSLHTAPFWSSALSLGDLSSERRFPQAASPQCVRSNACTEK
jgi:hypothetical protein